MEQRQRKTDKGIRRGIPFLHYIAAFALGWHLKGWFPDTNRIIDLVGDGWDWMLSSVQGLGGLIVIGSFISIVYNIYEKVKKKKR
jgi:hypothetical protein